MTDRQILKKGLANYAPSDPVEAGYVPRFEQLLRHPDCYKRSLASGHLTASCWVLDHSKTKVLLLHHAKLDKWLQPGGHADGDENLLRVATKELSEETGLTDCVLLTEGIFDIDIHLIPERKNVPAHDHFDVRFAFVAPPNARINKNHESHALAWVQLSEVPPEASLQRMVVKTSKL